MKIIQPLIIILIISFQNLFSQQYECVKGDDTYFFNCTDPGLGGTINTIRAYRIDSVMTVGENQILFTQNETIDRAPDSVFGCWDPQAQSWIGDVEVTPDGIWYFYNDVYQRDLLNWTFRRVHEKMVIKSNALPGESFTFYANDTILNYLYAVVTEIDTMHFLGIIDSVKHFEVYDGFGREFWFEFLLSKNHGLIQTINFRDFFPGSFYWFSSGTNNIEIFKLSGIENQNLGEHRINRGEIFNYEINDVFHIRTDYDDSQGNPMAYKYTIKTILDKFFSSNSDTIYYLTDYFLWVLSSQGTSFSHYNSIDKYFDLQEYIPDSTALTQETIFEDTDHVFLYESMLGYGGRQYFSDQSEYYVHWGNDSCFYSPFFIKNYQAQPYNYTQYIEGCGSYQTQKYDPPAWYACIQCSWLAYYKKGEQEWGTPFIIPVEINEFNSNKVLISVYPNPTNDILRVNVEALEPFQVNTCEIIDASGNQLMQLHSPGLSFELLLTELPEGLFFLKITSQDGRTISRKFIISR